MASLLFFVVYLVIVVVTHRVIARVVRRADRTDQLPALPLPSMPEPFEIAYLRKGAAGAARLATLWLFMEGYLEVRRSWMGLKQVVVQTASHPETEHLAEPISRMLNLFAAPMEHRVTYKLPFQEIFAAQRGRLDTEQLFLPEDFMKAASKPYEFGALFLLVVAVLEVGLLWSWSSDPALCLGVVGFVMFFVFLGNARSYSQGNPVRPYASKRGEAYVRQLTEKWKPVHQQVRISAQVMSVGEDERSRLSVEIGGADKATLLVTLALFDWNGFLPKHFSFLSELFEIPSD